jgi:hypothetical protein
MMVMEGRKWGRAGNLPTLAYSPNTVTIIISSP